MAVYKVHCAVFYLTFMIFPTEALLLIINLVRGPVSTAGVQYPHYGVMKLFLEKLDRNLIAHTTEYTFDVILTVHRR